MGGKKPLVILIKENIIFQFYKLKVMIIISLLTNKLNIIEKEKQHGDNVKCVTMTQTTIA